MLGKLTREEMEDLLIDSSIGRIGCSSNGMTYIVPVNYICDDNRIIVHGLEGRKIKWMRENPSVCFEVDNIINSTNWKSLIIQGTFEEITDELDRFEAMKLFVDRMIKLKISSTSMLSPETREERNVRGLVAHTRPVVFQIKINEMSGRFERD